MNTRKRLLFFSPYYYPYISGMTTYPGQVFQSLSKKFEVTVLTFAHRDVLTRHENLNGYQIIRMPYWFKISKGFIAPMSILTYISQLIKHDLVILNIPNVEGTPLAILARCFGKPILSFFHCVVTMPPGLFNRFIGSILTCANWIQLSLCTHIIGYTEDYCKSTWVGDLFRKKPNKFSFILPPVPDPVATSQDTTQRVKNEHEFNIGYAGRVATEKGLEVLVQAIAEIMKADPTSRYTLQIAGPYGKDVAGEDTYTLKIKSLLEKYSVSHHFFGTLSGSALTSFYRSLDVFVLPSINQTEAFGMVQVDAMKCGIPVVVSNLPGVRVPVQLTGMGIIVEPQNEKALSEAIGRILKNRSQYTSPDMIQKVSSSFSFSRSIEEIHNNITQSLDATS